MKRKNLKFVAFIAIGIAVTVFTGCKKDKPSTAEQGPVTNYLSSDNGNYVAADFPQAKGDENTIPVIENLSGNSIVLPGGTNNISITYDNSRGAIKEILVGIKGESGYLSIPSDRLKTSTLMLPLLLSQKAEGVFVILVALVDENENISQPYEVKVTTIEAGTGDLQVSLSWDKENDVDLYLEMPNGTEIFYGNIIGLSDENEEYFEIIDDMIYERLGEDAYYNISDNDYYSIFRKIADSLDISNHTGFLDIDSNPACEIDSIKNENITFGDNSKIPNGDYIVKVDLYADCIGHGKTNYSVTARYKGALVVPTSGTNPFISSFNYTDESNGDNPTEAMRFKISASNTVSVASFDFGNTKSLKSAPGETARMNRFASKKSGK